MDHGWLVILADDGSHILDLGDRILTCLRSPPEQRLLGKSTKQETAAFEHYRYQPDPSPEDGRRALSP